MAFTLNANFIKAMSRATVEPVVHCSIALSGTTMDFHNSPEALDSTVTGDPILGEVTSVSQSVDPVSRKVQHGEMTFTLVDDGKIRGLVSSQSFNEKIITVKLGETELALSDFVGIFKGPIISVIPQEGRIVIKARAFTHQFKGVKSYRTYVGDHPFAAVSQMLQDCGVASGDIDTASFTPSNHTDISHYNFSSIVYYNTENGSPPALDGGMGLADQVNEFVGMQIMSGGILASQQISIEDFINETMRLTRSTLVSDPASGDIKIVRYDSSASVAKHFTTDEYTDFEQVDGLKIITEVKTEFGKVAPVDLLIQSDNTAATNLGESDFSHTINYLSGSTFVGGSTLSGSSTALGTIGGEGGISGTRDLLLGGSQPADAKLSADRPFFGIYRTEVLKSTTAFTGTTLETIHSHRDHDGDLTGTVESAPFGFSTTLISRPFAGTEAGGAESSASGVATVVDATPAFQFGEYILNRFSNTCPVVRILVGLEHLNVEVGDLVSIDNNLFLSTELGLDGLDSTVKLEVTKREILPLGDSVGIELELTYATKSSPPSVTITSKPPAAVTTDFGRVPRTELIASRSGSNARGVIDNQTNTLAVTATSGLGISIAGGIAVASGMAMGANSAHALTMSASKHTYLGLNLFTGGIIKQEVATSADEPDLAAGELRLAKVITDGSSVTSIEDMRSFGAISIEQLDKSALMPGVNRAWNPSFDIWPDPGQICPGWIVNEGPFGTRIKRESSVVHSGPYAIQFPEASGDPRSIRSNFLPVSPNKLYRYSAFVRGTATGDAVEVLIKNFKKDRTASSTATTTISTANMGTANTWIQRTGVAAPPSDTHFIQIHLGADSQSGTLYVDDIEFTEEPPSFNVKRTSSNFTPSSSGDAIIFNTEIHDNGDNYNTSNGQFTVPEAGLYAFTAALTLVGGTSVRGVICSLVGSTAGTLVSVNVQDILNGTGTDNDTTVGLTVQAAELAKGETVTAQMTYTATAPAVQQNTSFFSGRKIS